MRGWTQILFSHQRRYTRATPPLCFCSRGSTDLPPRATRHASTAQFSVYCGRTVLGTVYFVHRYAKAPSLSPFALMLPVPGAYASVIVSAIDGRLTKRSRLPRRGRTGSSAWYPTQGLQRPFRRDLHVSGRPSAVLASRLGSREEACFGRHIGQSRYDSAGGTAH